MDNDRPIERRDFLRSATAASVLVGAASLAVYGDEPPKQPDGQPTGQGGASTGSTLVGSQAPDCFTALVRGMDRVRSVNVLEWPLTSRPKKRPIANGSYYEFTAKRPITLTADEEQIVSKALKLRADSKLPFWDAVLIVCQDHGNLPSGLLDAALYHQSAGSAAKKQVITRDQLLAGAVKQLCQTDADSKKVGITSEVTLDDGTAAHIPLLQFRYPISPANGKLVAEVAKRLLPGGAVILEAGTSYQAYARATIPAKDLAPLLGQALLFSHIVKQRYIAHQLIEGRCALRLSAGRGKTSIPVCTQVV